MSAAKPLLVIDARMVGPRLHGIARYVSILVRGLSEKSKAEPFPYRLACLVDRSLWEKGSSLLGGVDLHEVSAPFLSPKAWLEVPRALKSMGAALYHSPSFESFPYLPVPYVQTLHDLNHLTYGKPKEKLYYRTLLRRSLKNAGAIVAASKFARMEVEGWLSLHPGRVQLARNVLDPAFNVAPSESSVVGALTRLKLERGKYFLSLSPNKPHKNLSTLLAAYAMGAGNWPLVMTSGDLPASELPPGVIQLDRLRDEDMRALLSAAGALVFPSVYEGFGLPPMEAAVMGVPVLVSKIPAHEEALATLRPEEVIWLGARDPRAWSEAMKKAAQGIYARPSASSREKLREEFADRKLARDMDQIYRDLLVKIQRTDSNSP